MQALILAGGLGTRLGSLVEKDPKPFLGVDGDPFILKVVERLVEQNVSHIIFCLGYRASKIQDYFENGARWNVNISYVIESTLMGTAGAIRGALSEILDDDIIVVNGDSFCAFYLKGLQAHHHRHEAAVTLTVVKVDNPERYGLVEFDDQGRIKSFIEKGRVRGDDAYINAGVYIMNKSFVREISGSKPVSLEKEVLPIQLDRRLYAFELSDNRFIDIGTPESLSRAGGFFKGRFTE